MTEEKIVMNINSHIRATGLKSGYVAGKIGVVPATLSRKRRHKTSFTVGEILKIAEVCRVSPQELLFERSAYEDDVLDKNCKDLPF